MTLAEMQIWLSSGAMAVSLGTAAWSFLTAGSRKNEKAIQRQSELIAQQAKQIDGLERTVTNLPDSAALHRMELALSEVRGDMKVLTTSIEPMKNLISQINELLIENAKGKP